MVKKRKRKNRRFKINLNFVYKKEIVCSECFENIKPKELYFNFVVDSSDWGGSRIHFCKDCWKMVYKKSMLNYENNKDGYENYLKNRIVKSLMRERRR